MKNSKILLPNLISLLPIVYGGLLWQYLPQRLPIHFGINGQPDQYAPKLIAVIGLPVLIIVVNYVIIRSMKHKGSDNQKVFTVIIWSLPLLLNVVQIVTFIYALNHPFNIISIILPVIGVLLIVLGNYLPKTTPNYMIGIRLPETLHNSENWQKTNRIGGFVMVFAGFILIITGIIGNTIAAIGLILSMVLIIVVPTIYAIWLGHHQ
ncbi:MAG: SdpI family protein [Leuconostoc pseudomesenteroides]|uniref:SdpI family protein n=1 Tax=Leuconostoc pseudomesenteroides TaxID=33968 RepID=UPI0039E7FDA6